MGKIIPSEPARSRFRALHRHARLGNLGTLAATTSRTMYQWLLIEVYDLRHPHVGDDKHKLNGIRSFDPLGRSTLLLRANHRRLAA